MNRIDYREDQSLLYQGFLASLSSRSWSWRAFIFSWAAPRDPASDIFSCCRVDTMSRACLSVLSRLSPAGILSRPGNSVIRYSLPYLPAMSLNLIWPLSILRRTVFSDTLRAVAACLMVRPSLFLIPIDKSIDRMYNTVKLSNGQSLRLWPEQGVFGSYNSYYGKLGVKR